MLEPCPNFLTGSTGWTGLSHLKNPIMSKPSIFHVEVERPYDLIHFLKTILPQRSVRREFLATGSADDRSGRVAPYLSLCPQLPVK